VKYLRPFTSLFITALTFALSAPAIGQVVTTRISGLIEYNSTTLFEQGKGYTLDFTFDLSTTPGFEIPGKFALFDGAASDIRFNYDNGVYIGTAEKASMWVLNIDVADGFAVGLPFSGVNFPDVDGQSFFNVSGNPVLDLFGAPDILDSNVLVDPSGYSQFIGGDSRVRLRWGPQADILLSASVDHISSRYISKVPEGGAGVLGALAIVAMVALARRANRSAV
jgi:hypothetical protein